MLYTFHIKCVRFLLTKLNRVFSISYSFVDSFLTTHSMKEKLSSLSAVRFSVGGDMLVLAYNTIHVLWWTWSLLYSRRPDLAFFPREMTAGPRSDHHTPRLKRRRKNETKPHGSQPSVKDITVTMLISLNWATLVTN